MTGGRRVTAVNAKVPANCFLVYYFLAKDRIRCDPEGNFLNGSNEAGVLFESLDDARAFAQTAANVSPRIGSGVYASSWTTVADFVHEQFTRHQEKANSPSRLFLWASLLLLSGAIFLWIEIHSEWTLMFGFLIGARLLLSGVLKLAKGFYGLKRNARASTHRSSSSSS